MKKILYSVVLISLTFSCTKDWTTTQSKAQEFEVLALNDLKEKRDNFKWVAEAERVKENAEALEAYWADLRDYKQKSWLNTGKENGQKPMFYYWYSSDTWSATKGVAKSWLQALPDSITAISMWGGIGQYPSKMTENQRKDLEIFHKKGGAVLMCWQTGSAGLGLPGKEDGSMNGFEYFREKYPYEEVEKTEHKWGEIYARELARHIIAWGMDGYDIDWETCGDHGRETPEGTNFMMPYDDYKNLKMFIEEIAKYFGPKYSGAEREKYLEALFNPDTEGFHPNESIYIEACKPYIPENYKTKRYYLCADIPCGVPGFIKSDYFKQYFDKHFLQDYMTPGASQMRSKISTNFGGPVYNSTGANFQASGYHVVRSKADAINRGEVYGFGVYHGQTDFANSAEGHDAFKSYMNSYKIKRNYKHYAWTREVMRLTDPRPDYSNYKEMEQVIITP